MALNLSRRPVFPMNLFEDNLGSSIRLPRGFIVDDIFNEGLYRETSLFIGDFSYFSGTGDCYDSNGRYHKSDGEGSCGEEEPIFDDDRHCLPPDPFDMGSLINEKTSEKTSGSCSLESEGPPHEGLFYALRYLGVRDLLSVESVCRSLRSAVLDDNLLWRTITVDQSLSGRICDDSLVRLCGKAQGNLQCLSLVKCMGITSDGLKHVLERNPRLEKLSVPECTKLGTESIVDNLRALKDSGAPGIKQLKIGPRHDITSSHFEELKSLLSVTSITRPPKTHKPRFFHDDQSSFSNNDDDDRDIDIGTCPRCENLRLVYDCPAASCRRKQSSSAQCRGCVTCVPRCYACGQCLNDKEYEENFFRENFCKDCRILLIPPQTKSKVPTSGSLHFESWIMGNNVSACRQVEGLDGVGRGSQFNP